MGFFKKTIRDLPLDRHDAHRVLVRVDYNVPLKDGEVDDDLRIRASLPTLQYLLHHGCSLVLISHLGRPEGHELKYSLEPAAIRLSELLEQEVLFVDATIGDEAYQAVKNAPAGSVVMLQNLRFYPEEEADDHEFAAKIAQAAQADYFVQDGFGVVHRAHASTHAITQLLPSVSGLLLEREYTTISDAMESPKRPFVAVLGGAKVSDKIKVVERFVQLADTVLIGGAMANTFLAYKGYSVGASKVETDQKETLDSIYAVARDKVGENTDDLVILPTDVAVASKFDESEKRVVRPVDSIQPTDMALDIGDQSIEHYTSVVGGAGTVIWNGPLGVDEFPEFAHGSARLALTLATHPNIDSIVGGGDTADFVLKWDVKKGGSFTHVSTGGGASLDLMAGEKLPGVESLLDAS
ncbi:MAG: pgk, phosphoglycerate kinase [Candidatus Saccharibacteria bacterium]|nr:pgk, phosphoglycerate kinase [Candidatus Saccharibacteria bacterium]